MKAYRTPTILIAAPFVTFAALLVVMQLVYVVFQPPGVFDFLPVNASLPVQIAYHVNVFLFFALIFTPWVGAVFVLAGVTLLIKRFFARRNHA